MKKHILILTLLWLLMPQQVKAQPDVSHVQVVTSFYEPYSFLYDDFVTGVAVKEAWRVFNRLHFQPDIKIYPWVRAYNTALKSPNTLIFSMARTPEREDKFHWIGEIVSFNVFLFKDRDRSDIQLEKLEDAKAYKIGALREDVKGNYLRKHGHHPLALTNEETGINMILSGRIDLLPTDQDSMAHRLKKLGYEPDRLVPAFHMKEISRPLYMALSKNTPVEIVEAFRWAYEEVYGSGAR